MTYRIFEVLSRCIAHCEFYERGVATVGEVLKEPGLPRFQIKEIRKFSDARKNIAKQIIVGKGA